MTTVAKDGARRPAPWRLAMWGAIAALLLLPLVAMQVSREVAWTAGDFAAAAVLLVGGGALYELAAVALIWLDGAVGIF